MTEAFRFAHPEYLYLLLVLPILLVIFLLALKARKNNLKKIGEMSIIKSLMPDVSVARLHVKFWLIFFAAAFLVIAIAQPQFGSKTGKAKKEGVEIMLVLDVSNSMLAQDKDLVVNRLDKAKQIISKLIDNLGNDKVGLIVFAGEAYIQLPITTDYISAKMFLSNIDPGVVPVQGTAIGKAIGLAQQAFTTNEVTEKTIIVLTDGENHEDDAVAAAEAVAENNIRVHVVGIGSLDGTPVPVSKENTSAFKKDGEGNVIVSKLDEPMAQQIAFAGKGKYIRADNTNSAQKILEEEINNMNKSEFETTIYTEYNEQYHLFVWGALLLLLIEFLLFDRRNRLFAKMKLFETKAHV